MIKSGKRLLLALQDNVNKYEAQFGSISLSDNNPGPAFPISGNGTKS